MSFATQSCLTGPRDALEELGYTIDDVRLPRTKKGGISHEKNVVAIVCEPSDSSLDEIVAFLASAGIVRTLGILNGQSGLWKPKIIEQFTDFILWPCRAWELEARLDRLSPTGPSGAQTNAAIVTEAFVGLNLIGRSPAFVQVLNVVKNLARYDVPVLIQGATGTGKELLARALHFLSSRRDQPFIPINCGAIPDNLFENELFGHQKGAFTDANEAQPGLVELADKGTLFLDEAEALTPKAQVALLRFLDNQEYKPLGGRVVRKADVRLVAATNTDLQSLAAAGSFRADLLFRLNVALVRVPPLQLRRDDIELLADYFLEIYSMKYGLSGRVFSQELLWWLQANDWPGNVRELENFIQRALILSDGPVIHLPGSENSCTTATSDTLEHELALFDVDLTSAKAKLVNHFEERYLRRIMARTGGNVTFAARLAGKERRSFGKMLKKHCIDRENYSPAPQAPYRN